MQETRPDPLFLRDPLFLTPFSPSLTGWVNYFHYRNSNQALEKVKVHAEQRMRKHLMKRHKVKDRGIGEGRFPSVELYRRHGLYKVPTAAGWKSAHALA